MNPFRSVGARLSLALAVVVAGALAVVWVALVPTLQRRLVDGRLSLLAQSARQIEELAGGTTVDQDFIDDAARTADATRAVYLQPITAQRRHDACSRSPTRGGRRRPRTSRTTRSRSGRPPP